MKYPISCLHVVLFREVGEDEDEKADMIARDRMFKSKTKNANWMLHVGGIGGRESYGISVETTINKGGG